MKKRARVLHIVGARPNFMKIAPVMEALGVRDRFQQRLVHTGQHYDETMTELFFRDLGLPRPDRDLGAGGGSPAEQLAALLVRIDRVLTEERPDMVVVVGDVNSTLAAALAAARTGIPVAHVEAGLRSFDRSMPEEINRIVTDRLASILLTPSRDANLNLLREGVPEQITHFVGNVMIDTLRAHRERAPWPQVGVRFGVEERKYALLTLHRPGNVDDGGLFRRFSAVSSRSRVGSRSSFPSIPGRRAESPSMVSRSVSRSCSGPSLSATSTFSPSWTTPRWF